MSRSITVAAVVFIAALGSRAMAQDAEKGKMYDITIQSEENNPYTGPYGQTKIGAVVVMIPNAKKDEKYKITVTDVKTNSYTGDMQASCDFQQVGGDRKGNCLGAP